MRTVLILNPASGESMMALHEGTPEQNEETIVAGLRTYGVEPEVWHTTPEDMGGGLAKQAVEEGADLIIAAGGDGTVHAVANALIGSKSTLGIIAMGTMNNVAHSLSIPHTVEAACAIIGKGTTSQIDVGQINDQVFLEAAGIGLEAALFPAAEEIKSTKWLSTIRGVIDGLFTLFSFEPSNLKVSFDGHRNRKYKALQVTICNAPYYGARMEVAPGVLMDDGLLDVVIYKNFSKFEYIRHAISIIQGKRVFQPNITRRKVKSLRVNADRPVQIHADGVVHGHTPAVVTIQPSVLRVRVPEKVATGPHMADHEQKKTRHYKRARSKVDVANQSDGTEKLKGTDVNKETHEEKGPIHAK